MAQVSHHRDRVREFVNKIVGNVLDTWPGETLVITGRAGHPQSQGLVEQAQCHSLKRLLQNRNFRRCNIFSISQNQRFGSARTSLNQFSRSKNAFYTLCGMALLNFRSRYISGKNYLYRSYNELCSNYPRL